jgi:hypothetical protein
MVEVKVSPSQMWKHEGKWHEADEWFTTIMARSFQGQRQLDYYANGKRYITEIGYVYPTLIIFDNSEDAVYFKLKYPELLDHSA